MKHCNTCGITKQFDCFHKRSDRPNGYQSMCIDCRKQYRKENAENLDISRKAYYEKNRVSILSKTAEWAAKNKERKAATTKAWQQRRAEHLQAYRDARKDKTRVESAKWIQANKDHKRELVNAWRRKNPEALKAIAARRRARKAAVGGSFKSDDLKVLYRLQKGRCAHKWCAVKLGDYYHADHIKPLALGGSNDKSNIQLLCGTCNSRKGHKDPIVFAQQNNMLL